MMKKLETELENNDKFKEQAKAESKSDTKWSKPKNCMFYVDAVLRISGSNLGRNIACSDWWFTLLPWL